MRRVRYSVAMSLDGYVAGPGGESDWILMDPDIDFAALSSGFDTVLLGRKTYEAATVSITRMLRSAVPKPRRRAPRSARASL